MSQPLRFVFGLHVHQPVGNFDHVIAQHAREVYRPFLERATAADFFPFSLHVSGPLLEWLERHEPTYLDLVGRLVADGKLELLLAGFDEPILAALPRADRHEQIARMREYLRRRFGVTATGLWLTERVWEPSLAADLADAGVAYTFVDDRHFLVTGFRREELHRPFRTEADGRTVALLAIDERLRYLVPFRPPEEIAHYLTTLRASGHALAVLADDGEKFGGWPGTQEWVYDKGWLDRFFQMIGELRSSGDLILATGADAVRDVPSGGLAYLGTGSYREMEEWALPPFGQHELQRLELAHPASPFVRGGQWQHFLVKYPEANRMHKAMLSLSEAARLRGDPPAARRAIGRAQCNDAYWHGVFGGLYLPHLRQAVWRQLAIAERELRRDEPFACEPRDFDRDGLVELCLHGPHFSAVVSPHRGGAVETLVRFRDETNLADVLTRRREAYHETAVAAAASAAGHGSGAHSIHQLERSARLASLPPVDQEPRAILVDRVLPGNVTPADYVAGTYVALKSWARVAMRATVRADGADAIVIELAGDGLEKRLRFTADGCLQAAYRWDASAVPADAVFAPEISLAGEIPLRCEPPTDDWRYPITTVAKSERGLEETVQGIAITPRWPAGMGSALIEL